MASHRRVSPRPYATPDTPETPDAPEAPAAAATTKPASAFLPQIQALRAVAVLLVVVYHLKPARLSGGYIGVDVFFVISGYLMTAHLIRRSGPDTFIPSALADFYRRRIRRILPASLTVLLVVAIVSLLTVSRVEWTGYFGEIRASALYYENWSLASSSTDYLAGALTSPVQHFWSLSVEEQFYLGWPILLLGVGTLGAIRGKRAQVASIGIVLVLSLAYSIYATHDNAAPAYFNTFTRLWEFAVGGLVAALALVARFGKQFSALLGWAGLAAIAYTALTYTGGTPFPGYLAAIPVVGAALIIVSGDKSAIWGPHRIFRWRIVQYLGDISYSIYLWHFPLIVLYVNYFDVRIAGKTVVILFVGSLVLGALSKKFIEDPLRGAHGTKRGSRRADRAFAGPRTYGVAVAMMIPSVVIATIALQVVHKPVQRANAVFASVEAHRPSCFGAETLNDNVPGCTEATVSLKEIVPSPFIAGVGFGNGCQQGTTRTSVISCTIGSNEPGATRVALVGDSHATQWMPALRDIGAKRNWHITTYLKSGCALSTSGALGTSCSTWNKAVSKRLQAEKYAYVIVGARSAFGAQSSSSDVSSRVDGVVAGWRPIEQAGSRIIAIRDVPQPLNGGVSSVPACVYDHANDSACSFSQKSGERFELLHEAVAKDPAARLVDINSNLCQDGTCPAVIGKVLVYIDESHVTTLFAQSLEIPLDAGLVRAGMPATG